MHSLQGPRWIKKKKMDLQLAKFFFSENIPFIAAEGVQFKKLCEEMRPGYTPPSRKQIGGRLLDTVHEEIVQEIRAKLTEKETIVLTQDGWSSVTNDPIIAHTFNDGKENYLLNIKDTGSNKKTAQFCFELMDEAIQDIQQRFGKDVFGVCTDNEAKMKKLRDLVLLKYPDMIVYGCSAHYANLLEGDITNSEIIKHIVEIQKYFRNVHKAHGLLKEKGGCMPQLPNETRWNSVVDCLETFVKNHCLYTAVKTDMLQQGEDLPNNISRTVDNIGLMREAENLLAHMRKFSAALDQLQADNCHLADAVHIWNNLLDDKASIIQNYFIYY